MLYVIGGYGYSTSNADHITYDKLTAIDLDGVENAIINGTSIVPFFRQITYSPFAVTGGQMGVLNGTFYLAGGQKFTGRYNPMGGPSYVQDYIEEIQKFDIVDDGANLSVANYSTTSDLANLHRRDYNMSPQIFPNGDEGFTMFSGVFDPNDLPYLNSVDVTASGHNTNNNFTQYLSQYHSAKLPIYDADSNVMHTLFFGGMSQYTLDASGNLVQDDNVPFVKTISKVSRFSDGSMTELKLDIEMPTLVGSGAEFIPVSSSTWYDEREILKVNNLPMTKTLVGYIYGGIESTGANIFFSNSGTQSSASSVIFKVYISKAPVSTQDIALNGQNIFNLSVFPNPAKTHVDVNVFIPNHNAHQLIIMDITGQEIKRINLPLSVGNHSESIDISDLPKGSYLLKVMGGIYSSVQKIIKQ